MKSTALVAAMISAAVFISGVALAGTKSIDLPADSVQLKPSALPGLAKAQASCVVCHSAEYMLYQPATAP